MRMRFMRTFFTYLCVMREFQIMRNMRYALIVILVCAHPCPASRHWKNLFQSVNVEELP